MGSAESRDAAPEDATTLTPVYVQGVQDGVPGAFIRTVQPEGSATMVFRSSAAMRERTRIQARDREGIEDFIARMRQMEGDTFADLCAAQIAALPADGSFIPEELAGQVFNAHFNSPEAMAWRKAMSERETCGPGGCPEIFWQEENAWDRLFNSALDIAGTAMEKMKRLLGRRRG